VGDEKECKETHQEINLAEKPRKKVGNFDNLSALHCFKT